MNRSAKWIWMSEHRYSIDCYLLTRRVFSLPSASESATLEITACDRYQLYVNGKMVGEGPPRSEWPEIYADSYTLDELPLRRGKNVIAVLCHNTGLAQHGQPPGPGGLLLSLSAKCKNGKRVRVVSNGQWRMQPAPQYKTPAPRRLFTVGFAEVCDLRKVPDGWTQADFRDNNWPEADVVAKQPAKPYSKVLPCPIPRLVHQPTRPRRVDKCGYAIETKGITGLPFEFCVFGKHDDEFYGGSFVWSPKRQKVVLNFAADNRASVFVNNLRVLCQSIDDQFFNHLEHEIDTYTGLYYGHGHRVRQTEVTLAKGWNSLGVVIGGPTETWGFVMRFADRKTGQTLPLKISSDRSNHGAAAWQVISDAYLLDGGGGMILETLPLNPGTFPSPAHLTAWENRRSARIPGAETLCGKGKGKLSLPPNAFVTYEMPAELIGRIQLEIRGEAGAILDITAGEAMNDRGYVDAMRDSMFLSDRITLTGKWQQWRNLDRRAMRYIELISRNATRPIEVRSLIVDATHYPPPAPAEFKCSDKVLNKLWHVGLATLDACTQENFEDCPIREMAQWFGDTIVEGQIAAVAWGDSALTAKALRQFAADQPTDDWMRPMVPCGYGDKLSDYSLMYPYLLHRHYMYWGDRKVLEDCFVAVNRLMNYAEAFVDDAGFIRDDDNPRNMILLDHTVSKTHREMDIITGYQASYAAGLAAGAAVAEVLGRKAQARRWREQRDRIFEVTTGQLFDTEAGMFPESNTGGQLDGKFTATTNYWLLFAGLATEEQEKQILSNLWHSPRRENRKLWPPRENPYFKYFMLEALFSRGLWRQAFTVLHKYYGPMINRKDGWTLFEMYDPRTPADKPAKTNSLCHAYGAGPLVHYFRWILGIRPTEPGHKAVIIEPQLGDLSSLEGSVHTPQGRIHLAVKPRRGGRRIKVSLPDGVQADLRPTYLKDGDCLELG